MRQETFTKWFEKYHKGTYVVVIKETTKGDFTKQTKMVARFVNYYNIASVKAQGKSESDYKPRDFEEQIVPHILKLNKNTNNVLLCVYVTNHHKAHSTYYYKDMEITKEEYYTQSGDKEKTYAPTPLYNFKLQDVKSIGGYQDE